MEDGSGKMSRQEVFQYFVSALEHERPRKRKVGETAEMEDFRLFVYVDHPRNSRWALKDKKSRKVSIYKGQKPS